MEPPYKNDEFGMRPHQGHPQKDLQKDYQNNVTVMMPQTVVGLAEAADLPSIGTLHARAYHPARELHRRVFPECLAPWWEEKYAMDIEDPKCYVLKISSPDSPTSVLGLLSLRKYEANERGAGRWTSFAPPSQVDRVAYDAMIKSMVDYRERFMFGQVHLCIDHFGVDATYQRRGLGKMLIVKTCKIADQEGLDIFVQANEFAETFYQNFGFTTEERLEIPPDGVTQCFLIRRCR